MAQVEDTPNTAGSPQGGATAGGALEAAAQSNDAPLGATHDTVEEPQDTTTTDNDNRCRDSPVADGGKTETSPPPANISPSIT